MGRTVGELVRAAVAGEAKAVRDLVEATQKRLFKFCLVLCGDPVRAEDLAQETYLKALASLSKLKDPEAFVDWLFRITRHTYIDEIRRNREVSGDADEVEAERPDLVNILAVHKTLSQFEPEDRYLLALVDMENYTYREAAAILGISEDAVRTRLFRLRKAFIEKFKKPETK